MARENKTRFAVLGLLSLKPMTGYEMKGIIPKSVGYFWNESFGQIYPMLNQLANEGLVTGVEETEGRHHRIRYTLTDTGHQALRDWLAVEPEYYSLRDELLLKLFFGKETEVAVLRGHLEKALASSRRQLAVYQGIEAELKAIINPRTQTRFSLITVRKGLHWEQAQIEWCLESLAALPPVLQPQEAEPQEPHPQ
ncbi:MAG: PadR family transcriptional regulator [Deltaproteobacteria bacterium]|nr:PadR family transcriptional regulator [Deltaproteobacteria bacterium]